MHLTPTPQDVTHHDIVWLAGPRLIGLMFNWTLLGTLSLQVYVYFLNFPQDRRFVKCLVYCIYVIDFVQTCSATYDGFQWFVYGWGNVDMLYELHSSWLNVPILSSLVGAAVQLFFGWRVWSLSHSLVIFYTIAFLALLQLGGASVVGYYLYNDPSEVNHAGGLIRAVGIRLAVSAVVDTVIASSMTYYLLKSRKNALGSLSDVITRLVRIIIETGSITALAAIVDLVFYISQHNGLHQVSGVILGKLYANTLLVLFNNRILVNKGLYNPEAMLSGDLSVRSASVCHQVMHDRAISVTVDVETGGDTASAFV